jgi:hypothetical protein
MNSVSQFETGVGIGAVSLETAVSAGCISCKKYLLRIEHVEFKGQRIFFRNDSYKQVNLA